MFCHKFTNSEFVVFLSGYKSVETLGIGYAVYKKISTIFNSLKPNNKNIAKEINNLLVKKWTIVLEIRK